MDNTRVVNGAYHEDALNFLVSGSQ